MEAPGLSMPVTYESTGNRAGATQGRTRGDAHMTTSCAAAGGVVHEQGALAHRSGAGMGVCEIEGGGSVPRFDHTVDVATCVGNQ